jgi:hypothetical protein
VKGRGVCGSVGSERRRTLSALWVRSGTLQSDVTGRRLWSAMLGDAEEACRSARWRGGWVRLVRLLPVQGTSVLGSVCESESTGRGLAQATGAWGLGGELGKARASIGGQVVAGREKEEDAKNLCKICIGLPPIPPNTNIQEW